MSNLRVFTDIYGAFGSNHNPRVQLEQMRVSPLQALNLEAKVSHGKAIGGQGLLLARFFGNLRLMEVHGRDAGPEQTAKHVGSLLWECRAFKWLFRPKKASMHSQPLYEELAPIGVEFTFPKPGSRNLPVIGFRV